MINLHTSHILFRAKLNLQRKIGTSVPLSLKDKIKLLYKGLIGYVQYYIFPAKTFDVLFVTSNHYETLENKLLFDKFITPFVDFLEKRNKRFKIARFSNEFYLPKNYFRFSSSVPLQSIGLFHSKFFQKKPSAAWVEQTKEMLRKSGKELKADEIEQYLSRFLSLKDAYYKFLKRSKVQHLVIVCYYDLKSFAIIQAANELGIPSIDLQHGVQGKGHFAYNSLNRNFDVDSKLFPTHFWSWDQYSASVIKEWFHQPENVIIGGNKWMLDRINPSEKKYITFTLQPMKDALPEWLLLAIKDYKGDLTWCLRLHPHQLSQKDYFRETLKDYGIYTRIHFEDASELPLSELLNQTKIHITQFSSVVLEAYWYNIPSIVISDQGILHFKDSCPSEFLFYASNAHDLLKKISELSELNDHDNLKIPNSIDFDQLANQFFRFNKSE